jgi:septal ring factor EnvC (AmiA/AmiB activator)
VAVQLRAEQRRLTILRARLARARMLLSRQLVSSYEGDRPDLVSVVLSSTGFKALLEEINFLGRAEHQQQSIIGLTRAAKAQATAAAARLSALQARERQMTQAAGVRQRALVGMNSLLQAKQGAMQRARGAQQAELVASQSRSAGLRSTISHVRAQQAAAARAAAAAAAAAQAAANAPAPAATPPAPASSGSSGPAAPVSAAPSGGWAIPSAIVLCESGGQNLPPNSAGASGYYQIMPATWRLFGGSGPAAYLASKAEQDAVATRIWNGGAGASNWVCAGIVGVR